MSCHRHSQRGVTYLIALVSLVVLTILGLAVMRLTKSQLDEAINLDRQKQLHNLAEAGLEYGYYIYAHNWGTNTLPWDSGTVALGDGSFRVVITDNSAQIARTVKLTATSYLPGGATTTTTRVVGMTSDSVFYYAIAGSKTMSISKKIITGSGGVNGDVYVNGDLKWTTSGSTINGDAWATGSITTPVPTVTGTRNPSSALITFPPVDLAWYQSHANRTYTSNQSWTNLTFAVPNEIIYVIGDFHLKGVVTGTGTVVSTKNIFIDDDLTYADSACKIALLGTAQLTISNAALNIVGAYYAHNSGGTGKIITKGILTVSNGCLATDTWSLNNTLTVVHDPDLNAELCTSLRLPGFLPS